MEMRFEKTGNILIAHLQMFLDQAGAENFKYVLLERMTGNSTVILDLEKLVHIDTFGLDALLAAAQKALDMNSKIVLANVSSDMQIVLDITKVYRVFEIYPSVEEALKYCQKEDI